MGQILKFLCLALVLLSTQLVSVQAAYCDDIWVEAEDIFVERNETNYFYFPVHNDEGEDFRVYEVRAWRDEGDFEIDIVDYPTRVEARDEGELTIRVRTESLDYESEGRAYIKVRGMFDEGEYCNFSDIDTAYFDVTVETDRQDHECNEIQIDAQNVYIDEDSTKIVSFSIENDSGRDFELLDIGVEENSSYFDAELYSKPRYIDSYERESFRVRIEADRVSGDRQSSVEIEARGRFDNGEYCSYSNIAEERFTVFVENQPGTSPGSSEWCNEIYLDAGTSRVEKGRTEYKTIFLENDSPEDFLIDFVSVFDSSSNFKAEENGYAKVVPAFGSSYINVKIRAYDYAETEEAEAFVEVRGHFQNKRSCYLFPSKIASFQVIVEERSPELSSFQTVPEGTCTYFSLIAPALKQIENSGTIPITIDNRTMERATIRLYGPGMIVQPKMISVPRHTLVSESISVSTVLEETNLVYSVEALGCNTTEETAIISTAFKQEEEPSENEETEEVIESISTGFVVLGQAAAALGLIILAAIVVFYIFKR